MSIKKLKVGIISKDEYIKRTIAIARGDYRPGKDEPKVWFDSVKSMAQVLGNENQQLLKMIIEHKPRSLSELERLSNRKKSTLSRTLKTLENYGVVELSRVKGRLVPQVKATDFSVEFGLHSGLPVGISQVA